MGFGPRTSAVYRWEREFVHLYDRTCVGESQIKGIVAHVWQTYGLRSPPKVGFQSGKWSHATRTEVVFGDRVSTAIVLHELAHSMDTPFEAHQGVRDERTREWYDEDAHGPNWLGLYVNLLDKFMPQPEFRKLYLMGELARRRLDFSYAPKLRCL